MGKVQIDKDRVQDSYEFYRKLEKDTKERYEMYDSWCEDKKKSYEEYTEKSSVLIEKTETLEEQIKELEQRKSDKAEEVQTQEIKLDIVQIVGLYGIVWYIVDIVMDDKSEAEG